MTTPRKIQLICLAVALVGFVWLTVDVFDAIEPDSLQAAALLTWAGLIGGAICALICANQKNKQ